MLSPCNAIMATFFLKFEGNLPIEHQIAFMSLLNYLILTFVGKKPDEASDNFNALSDEALVVHINKTKSTVVFAILYDRYSQKVYNKCYSFSKNLEEAQDLTQDVFLKVFIALGSFKGTSKFSTWLYALTYNYCANYVTRDIGKKLDKASDNIGDHEYHLQSEDDIEDAELFKMKVSKLEAALERIDIEDKTILLLKYQDDVSIKELQTVLNIGESAVKMRLKRAKVKLIEAYNKLG